MDDFKKDDLETDENFEEKSKEISKEEIEEKEVVNESVEKEDVKQEDYVKTETIQQDSDKQGDFKKSFDKVISKKNLLEYIMGGISIVFSLSLLVLIFNGFKFIFLDGNIFSGISTLVSIGRTHSFIVFLLILSGIVMTLMYYRDDYIQDKKNFLKSQTNLSFLGGVIFTIFGNLLLRLTYSKILIFFDILIYIVALLCFITTSYMLYLIIFKKNSYDAGKDIAGAESIAEKVKSVYYSAVTDNVKKHKKYIISGIVVLVLIVVGIFGYKTISNMSKPDAIVSLSGMKITLNVSGYDGYGVVESDILGEPSVQDVKDKKKLAQINESLMNYKIEYSKEKGIKNGDEITATLKFEDTAGLKLKFDTKKVMGTVKASGLKEFVRYFKDVEKHFKRMEEQAKKDLEKSNKYSDSKNLKIEKIAIYETPLEEEQINSAVNEGKRLENYYRLVIIYKITGERKELLSEEIKPFEDFKYYEFNEFKKRGDTVSYSTNNSGYYFEKSLDDIENELQTKGYKKVK